MLSVVITLMLLVSPSAVAQQASPMPSGGSTIKGIVLSFDEKPVSDAAVTLEKKSASDNLEMKTNASGAFEFSPIAPGSYQLAAEKSGLHSQVLTILVPSKNNIEKIRLVLQEPGLALSDKPSAQPEAQAMEFTDQPNFTVAGVTDWTAVGGHGSDSILRTSESLASDTATLKPQDAGHIAAGAPSDSKVEEESESKLRVALANAPGSFETNFHMGEFYLSNKQYQEAIPLLESAYRIDSKNEGNLYDLGLAYVGSGDLSKAHGRIHELLENHQSDGLYRLMGELDEKSGDPLSAVHEYEQAVKLSPSEQNYFEWGSELLLHRAVWQAQEVFRRGADAYPKSARMQTALGTALFAGARYDEAALHLCAASDLNPSDSSPYIFMGKIQMAAPNSLVCIEPKLARFVQQEPENSVANYLYAMAILKQQEKSPDKQAVELASVLLLKAVTIDPKCSEAYLQLGIISASQRSFQSAIDFYKKAIEANPQNVDAHYHLAMAYDRTGQSSKAKQELQLHDQIKRQQAEAVDRQRREVKQFLIVQPGDSGISAVK
ncbi:MULTISPECIES: tetratricopeptide repeat protein [Acidobacteriaceae]|uniref:tetratricopeptide repeat protein n=1 Tax=Acidobacteriaceae TaxID=204434 RepID=UPI00131A8AD4|nr:MULTISPECIES: tetratricopeptide repeat protein [Acidobacteriaceae]MDW5267658.1 tetratricopeptide repeat protein [Edaphobacter sp.]